MTVLSHKSVKACVERAMLLAGTDLPPEQRLEAAIASTAQAMAVTVDDVRACMEQETA